MNVIGEIAKRAKVSTTTVSNVLKNKGNVSNRLVLRVLDAASQLNLAERLGKKETANQPSVIGITLNMEEDRVLNEFEQNFLSGILSVCDRHGYYALIKPNNRKKQNDNHFPIHGEILLNPENDKLFTGNVPHVWVGMPPLKEREQIPYVDNDNELIGFTVTEYLIHKGHQEMMFLNSPVTKTVSHSRKQGFEYALAMHGLSTEDSIHYFTELERDDYEQAYEITVQQLSNSGITAAIVNSEVMAQAVYKACEDLGKSIPEDLSVISIYGDRESCDGHDPPLTSIELNEFMLGEEAAKLLLSIIGFEKTSGGGSIVPTYIIERNSVSDR